MHNLGASLMRERCLGHCRPTKNYGTSPNQDERQGNRSVEGKRLLTPGTPILDPLFSRNVGGLVLFCIEADFCDQGLILQHFSRSTKFTFLRTGRNSIFVAKLRMKFYEILLFFRKNGLQNS